MALSSAHPPRLAAAAVAALVLGAAALAVLGADQAHAQAWVGVPSGPPKPTTGVRDPRDPKAQMLVRADEVQYDTTNERVIAVGHVQIYYRDAVLEADRVVYAQKAKRLRAEGNVRLTEADGKVVTGNIIDLNDEFRDGFVDSLRLEGADKTTFVAPRADRTEGTHTVFQSGAYTACLPCADNPKAPPKWQVKSARIIHNEAEKMVYFESARLEVLGIPIMWWPYLSMPDPTVKKKTGFLFPRFSYSTIYGLGAEVPYYWVLAPDYDVTLSPKVTSKQGVLVKTEWRQRLINGAYDIRAAGIYQTNWEKLPIGHPGRIPFRGSIETTGQFALSKNWHWGWDGTVVTDKNFIRDYGLFAVPNEAISQIYLTGRGERSYFDLRAQHIYGYSSLDVQKQLPIIHPVLDYSYVFGQPVLGGELGYRVNLTSLTRQQADFDPVTTTAKAAGVCEGMTASLIIPASCLLRGVPGTYSRLSAEATWRRTIIDPYGQVFIPFAVVRADVAAVSIRSDPGVSNFIGPGEHTPGRVMPAVGLEYRYPFISVHSWGTQTIEPIAQVILRPDEQNIGAFPNEDAQSLVFDTSTLFRVNKFSGWDRVEGGSRLNAGVQYSAQFNHAGFVSAAFGQSYSLFGKNSYAVGDLANAGLNSGLESTRSDYVASFTFQPGSIYRFTSRFRFDEQTFEVRRTELEARATFDRWTVSMLYGNYSAQPEIGFLTKREGVLGQGSFKLTQNWSLHGLARYDVANQRIDAYQIGLGYIDDCFAIGLTYQEGYSYLGSTQKSQQVVLSINLRTIGGTSYSHTLGQNTNQQSPFFNGGL